MQRSSDTIGAIAGALAKAQIEIANPERSLTARSQTARLCSNIPTICRCTARPRFTPARALDLD
jgi:hypothetical protein